MTNGKLEELRLSGAEDIEVFWEDLCRLLTLLGTKFTMGILVVTEICILLFRKMTEDKA